MIRTTAYARAALIGNPSDGYYGKTIAFVFKNFSAVAELTESDTLQILPCTRDRLNFKNINELAQEIQEYGYYGGVRLVKATIKTFYTYCHQHNIVLPKKNFTVGYTTTIPHRLGLAGSSAIVTAVVKAIIEFYKVEIPKPILANLILSVEKDELKISAGLQDRVAQIYGCPVYMNFDSGLMQENGYGQYISFDKALLPPLYLAYHTNLSEGSEILHNDLAARYTKGEPTVIAAIEEWKELSTKTWDKLQQGDKDIAALINRNYDLRESICAISNGNKQLIQTARASGASAKFTGSGGAIIGTYENEKMFDKLNERMKKIDAIVIKPDIA